MKGGWERQLIAGGFGLALLFMGYLRFISYQNAIALIYNTNQVERTEDQLNHLVEISAVLAHAEARAYSYVLSGQESDRQRQRAAQRHLNRHVHTLSQSLASDPRYQADMAALKTLVAERHTLADQWLTVAANPDSTVAQRTALMAEYHQNRQAIEQVLATIATQKTASLTQWDTRLLQQTRRHLTIELLGTLLVLALLIGLYLLLDRQLVQRHKVESERQQLAQAKAMGDLKLRFFSMVSHEFRTPLSVILGSAQLLAEDMVSPDAGQVNRNLDRIQASARSMNQLLTDILTLTRAEAGKLSVHPTAIDLEEFCLNLVEDMSVMTQPPRQIQFLSGGQPAKACLDEKLLHALLSNLLSNALKYSAPESVVSLSLNRTPETVRFEIRDRGIGITAEDLANLYDPFYRGHNVGHIQGAGLGLAVCQKCVELHGGTIRIQSEVGVGTTVLVTLPAPLSPIVKSEQRTSTRVTDGSRPAPT
jgi:signal transduction histidine kinase